MKVVISIICPWDNHIKSVQLKILYHAGYVVSQGG